ncbi:MAG: sialate O-acetylesterase [Verrucomicrobiota bacterium JB022]|nr:sialate O-acetylesterase [Verrucomicrobiota bacterium JB022]
MAHALTVADLFAPHAVLQREAPIRIWGEAGAGAGISVALVRDTPGGATLASATATAGSTGGWELELPAQSASDTGSACALVVTSGTDELRIAPIHIGDVWLCSGQSNMNFLMRPYLPWSEGVLDWEGEVAAAGDPLLSVYTVVPIADWQPTDAVHGSWRPDTTQYAPYFSAVPYLFAREIRAQQDVPVGVIVASLGGTSIMAWLPTDELQARNLAAANLSTHATRRAQYADELDAYYEQQLPAYIEDSLQNHWAPTYAAAYSEPYPNWRYQPGGLYHGMIGPLERFPVAGIVWYQGESDTRNHGTYDDYLTALAEVWRGRRNDPDLPLLVVQLQNHDPVERGSDPALFTDVWAEMRLVQQQTVESLPAAGFVVTADVGDALNIHPRDKHTVVKRLGLLARRLAYGDRWVLDEGPAPLAASVDAGGKVVISFDHCPCGMVLDSTRANGDGPDFQLAGADGVFHAAEATVLDRHRLEISSANVSVPMQLRYAFHNDPRLILYNREGLPAAPFNLTLTPVP